MKAIPVNRPFLPPLEAYNQKMAEVWGRSLLTNNGPELQAFEQEVTEALEGIHVVAVANGTLALQLAIQQLRWRGQRILTTPYSYIATLSSLLWEGCEPVFVDIDPETFQVDPLAVEAALRKEDVAGMLFAHCYGLAASVEQLEALARAHGVPLVYDGAHAFGSRWKDRPLLTFGTLSVCSFHATKIMHSIEGGAVLTKDPAVAEELRRLRNFGHNGPVSFRGVGVNAKVSEVHAAMGRLVLGSMTEILDRRKAQVRQYHAALEGAAVRRPSVPQGLDWNGAYYPVVFSSEEQCKASMKALEDEGIFTRRYFFPALHAVGLTDRVSCPHAESISSRVLCLPLFHDLTMEEIAHITGRLRATLTSYP